MKTFSKQVAVIVLCLAVLLILLCATTVYAAVNGIYENHYTTALSDSITLDDSGLASKTFVAANSATNVVVNKVHNANSTLEATSVELVVFSTQQLQEVDFVKYAELTDGRFFYVFTKPIGVGVNSVNFTFTPTNQADVTVLVVVDKITPQGGTQIVLKNHYITSFFDLKVANDQKFFEDDNTATVNTQSYSNLWFVDDITVTEDFVLRIPSYINLLDSVVTLDGDLTILHSFGGQYTIDGTSGGFVADVSTPATLKIVAPNAYYTTEYLTSAPSHLQNVTITDYTEFELTDVTDIKTNTVFDAALSFAFDRIPNSLFFDMVLPNNYQGFDITYRYKLNDTYQTNWQFAPTVTDSVVTVDVEVLYGGVVVKQAQKSVKVYGTGDNSLTQAATDALTSQINTHYTFVDNKIADFNKNCDVLNPLMSVLRSAQGTQSLTVSVNDTSGSRFGKNDDAFLTFDLTYTPSTGLFELSYLIEEIPTTVAVTQQDKIELIPATFLEQDGTITLSAVYGSGTQSNATFTLVGNTRRELESYINQMTNTPYVMSTTDKTKVFYVDSGQLKLDESNLIDVYSFASVVGGVIKISQQNYQDLVALYEAATESFDATDLNAYNTLLNGFVDSNSYAGFNIINGELVPSASVPYEEGSVYVFYQTFNYDLSSSYYTAEMPAFSLFREVVIPSSGIGGNQYQKYLSGNTFAGYFDSLPNNRLLDTTGFASLLSGADVFMNLRFTDESGQNNLTYDYIKFLSATDNYTARYDSVQRTQGFKLFIDINNVPITNTPIYLKVEFVTSILVNEATQDAISTFYVEGAVWDEINNVFVLSGNPVTNATAGATQAYYVLGAEWYNGSFYQVSIISTQPYSFAIPGIFLCSSVIETAQFADEDFYQAIILNIKNNVNLNTVVVTDQDEQNYNLTNYVYTTALGAEYLLADGAKILSKMIYSFDGVGTAPQLNPKGIQYLTNVTQIDLSGYNLTSLQDFANFSGTALVSLSLSNCAVTDAKIGSNLLALTSLRTADLSQNSISNLNNILYRTVTNLNLSGQTNLTSLNGIVGLNSLTTLDISSNNIDEFCLLTKLNKLTTAILYGNIGSNDYYGTCGSVNIAEYVTLLDTGVQVFAAATPLVVGATYVADTTANTVTSISTDQRLGALQLNAILIPQTFYSAIVTPVSFNGVTVNFVALTLNGVAQTVVSQTDAYGNLSTTCTALSNGDEVKVILSVTYNGVTVYKQFNLVFMD